MININGEIIDCRQPVFTLHNRGINYGDALFESMRFVRGRLIFGQDHIDRLLDSMRVLHMETTPEFSSQFLVKEIKRILPDQKRGAYRVKLLVWRSQGGGYTPKSNCTEYAISGEILDQDDFKLPKTPYSIGVFDEVRLSQNKFSSLKTTNKLLNVLAGIYAKEMQWDNCILLNEQSRPVEAINGNLFLVHGNTIITPSIDEGCLNGILRKQLLRLGVCQKKYFFKEGMVLKEDLEKADELWITNSISGIIPVTQFGEKRYVAEAAQFFIEKLNNLANQL